MCDILYSTHVKWNIYLLVVLISIPRNLESRWLFVSWFQVFGGFRRRTQIDSRESKRFCFWGFVLISHKLFNWFKLSWRESAVGRRQQITKEQKSHRPADWLAFIRSRFIQQHTIIVSSSNLFSQKPWRPEYYNNNNHTYSSNQPVEENSRNPTPTTRQGPERVWSAQWFILTGKFLTLLLNNECSVWEF